MFAHAVRLAAVAAAFVTSSTLASPLLDFEGLSVGAYVNDYYNGGADSLGESGGANYGIHMSGWKVYADNNGNKYAAGSGISFTARNDIQSMSFAGVGPDPYGDYAMYAMNGYQRVDALWPAGVDAWIDQNRQWHFGTVLDAVHTYTWGLSGYTLTGFDMALLYLDNLSFNAPNWVALVAAGDPVDPAGTVPLPGTLALLGAGALAMRRRRG